MTAPQTCKGLNCSSTRLIDSHIIAKGFARLTREDGRNIEISQERVGLATPQLGYFDKNILCASCDNKIGAHDDYMIELCQTFSKRHRRRGEHIFEIQNVDCNKVATFFLSLLWRGSISTRLECKSISLGALENRAREVVFGAKPLNYLPQFKLMVLRLESAAINASGFYTMPQRYRFDQLNGYRMSLVGFRFIALVDARNAPDQIQPFILNGGSTLRGIFVSLEGSDEFRQMRNLANPFRRLA